MLFPYLSVCDVCWSLQIILCFGQAVAARADSVFLGCLFVHHSTLGQNVPVILWRRDGRSKERVMNIGKKKRLVGCMPPTGYGLSIQEREGPGCNRDGWSWRLQVCDTCLHTSELQKHLNSLDTYFLIWYTFLAGEDRCKPFKDVTTTCNKQHTP